MRSLLYCVPAPLNAALVANEENAAKAECLELKPVCFGWGFVLQFPIVWVCENRSQVSFVVGLSVSEADSLVESQLCDIVFLNELFGVVGSFSTALFVPSGFSDRRFETAPELSFQST
ncbi:hypothetical protein V6G34_003173 [Vibrio parahaemolyticus]|nr:hypothetical protein [Vibrio parahaemolyticus]